VTYNYVVLFLLVVAIGIGWAAWSIARAVKERRPAEHPDQARGPKP